jgi:DegV family protein with EDD domain
MSRVHIVTDSTTQFPNPRSKSNGRLTFAPIQVQWKGESVEVTPDMNLASLRSVFREHPGLPRTTPPSVDEMIELYRDLQDQTDEIISLHTSESVSNIVDVARKASEHFLGRCDIQVIDSGSMSAGLGLLVEAALTSANQGEPIDEVVRVIRGMIPRMYMVLFLTDLVYLEQNNLISRSQAILGNMLGIIPFLTMENGRLIPMEKVRTRTRALEKLFEFVSEFSNIEHISILQASAEQAEDVAIVEERLNSLNPHLQIARINYGPALATFIGPDGLGVVVLEGQDDSA